MDARLSLHKHNYPHILVHLCINVHTEFCLIKNEHL
uniref:Uncharacterized protein n=1 Tax=Anguilla anguilla TaxID=7936 RepID=A0A0E9QJX4_ANGAN